MAAIEARRQKEAAEEAERRRQAKEAAKHKPEQAKRPKFDFQKERPQVMVAVANALQAANNLVNSCRVSAASSRTSVSPCSTFASTSIASWRVSPRAPRFRKTSTRPKLLDELLSDMSSSSPTRSMWELLSMRMRKLSRPFNFTTGQVETLHLIGRN